VTAATGDYDDYAGQYSKFVAGREQGGPDPFGLLEPLLALLGEIAGRRVLDAGCGEGYLARLLAARGAHVTGIDLSPRLIELGRTKDSGRHIDYPPAGRLPPGRGLLSAVHGLAFHKPAR
jgi:2-polyprenyl-3-methyl-5-hydroxy-6-metoxy-1,4-benzoquinol methylase